MSVVDQISDAVAEVDGILLQLERDNRHRAAQARGQLEAALESLKRARGFLLATSSGFSFPVVKPDEK